jgi:hypothetical protein
MNTKNLLLLASLVFAMPLSAQSPLEDFKRNLASQLCTLDRASHLIKLSVQVALVDILLHPSRVIEKFLHHSAIVNVLLGKLLLHHLDAHAIFQAIQVSVSLIHIVHIMLAGIMEDVELRIHAKQLMQAILLLAMLLPSLLLLTYAMQQ